MKPFVVVLAVLSLLLAGCQTYPFAPANPPPPPTCEELAQQEESPENLSFETIARESAQGYAQLWPENEPALFLTTLDEITEIESYIRKETAAALQDVDFGTSLVVAAFSGQKSHGAWGFCVTSITRQDDVITLHTHLVDSSVAPGTMASYYHLVRLPREELLTGEVTFYLALTRHEYVGSEYRRALETSEEQIVASVTRSLP